MSDVSDEPHEPNTWVVVDGLWFLVRIKTYVTAMPEGGK
uniref:Uncharacterized protein n=1 Tax=Anguilla anguilla TaxID=7936 RepID=A0A0E9PS58_ANGAN